MKDVVIRPGTPGDAGGIADVYIASRKALVAHAPLAHPDDAVRRWIANRVVPESGITVAVQQGEIIGMMAAVRRQGMGWLDHLYIHPARVGRGVGTRLLQQAKDELGPPVRLYTFQASERARRFYEHHGFAAVIYGDGSGNEEGCPDVLYEWDNLR